MAVAPAVEILINTPLVADMMRKGEVHLLKELMTRSTELGMQTFDQALYRLYDDGLITYEDALAAADSNNDLRLMIKLKSETDAAHLDRAAADLSVEEDSEHDRFRLFQIEPKFIAVNNTDHLNRGPLVQPRAAILALFNILPGAGLMPRTPLYLLFLLFSLAACTALLGRDPLNVTLVGIEPLPGEGMEVRMAVKLRVQNPNDAPVTYDGVAMNLELRGNDIASGVSDARAAYRGSAKRCWWCRSRCRPWPC